MNQRLILRHFFLLFLIIVSTSFSYGSPNKKFNPAGTWEYTAPNVAEGYRSGKMIITEKEEGYRVLIALDEYNQLEANHVEFEKNSLTFNLYVEGEFVTVTGEFNKDEFIGTVSYSEGVFDITAIRKPQDSEN